MIFTPLKLYGAYCVDLERHEDDRGFFARAWCAREYEAIGLTPGLVQASVSFNKKNGTLRGMHFQVPPSAEIKIVRCTRGALYDVIVDLRPQSKTFLEWTAVELTAENGRALYIPQGFAHGFQTLANETEIFYQMSEFYAPECARGFRWNDPAIGIVWPEERARVISVRDREYEDFATSLTAPLHHV